MNTSRNIGGSILPSSAPHILTPLKTKWGVLTVVPMPDRDTHALTLDGLEIANHPNGFSCRALAERMESGNIERVIEQSDFIVRCGGFSIGADAIRTIMKP